MPNIHHLKFIEENKDLVKDAVLIIGSKIYDYDIFNLKNELARLGIKQIIGIDIREGEDVDYAFDILESQNPFFEKYNNYFSTVICMEVLYIVEDPFLAARNITGLLTESSALLYCESFSRKISAMPTDYWRFTYDGHKKLFKEFEFINDRARYSFTRGHSANSELLPFNREFDFIRKDKRHPDESYTGYLVRRIHNKYLSKGIFNISRLYPEITIFSAAIKK